MAFRIVQRLYSGVKGICFDASGFSLGGFGVFYRRERWILK